jgi:ABC-2 type transport system ATP-binding protein
MVQAATTAHSDRAPAIKAVGVTKAFAVHSQRATSIKERLLRRDSRGHEFRALDDVSIEIPFGHTVGLIGRNGSGKSTFLKVLAGILRPTTGSVVTNGRISSLLELGAGFNGELSGRDNVYLNASLLGLTRRETDGLFDSIVEFAELSEFIDNPVKHYSSGMYVRLGFSVAVHVQPDILLVDEVLAVGDEAFAQKCLAKIAEFQEAGRTILFVSHDLDLVERMCDRAVVLDAGRVVFDGDPSFATGTLRGLLGTEQFGQPSTVTTAGVTFPHIGISGADGPAPGDRFHGGDDICVRVVLTVGEHYLTRVDSVGVVIMGAGGIPIWVMRADHSALPRDAGTWTVELRATMPRIQGSFRIAVEAADSDGHPIAAEIAPGVFTVVSGQPAGILAVDYDVAAVGS